VKIGPPPPPVKAAQLKEACRQFEALFINEMLKEMRQASKTGSGALGESRATDLAQDMQDQTLSDTLAGGLGLERFLFQNLQKTAQESPENDDKSGDGGGTRATGK
jgi:flagellar protein FlgJ